jgi:hypothetical protein
LGEKGFKSFGKFGNIKTGTSIMKRLPVDNFSAAKFLPLLFLLLFAEVGQAIPAEEIRKMQAGLEGKTVGERIASFAEGFVGIPYDRDPQGEYVTRATIVADERVDCMYLTFRAVELALGRTPEEALQIALDKRFHSRGILQDGQVANYEDRFEYGEDMIQSGKWGKEVTRQVGRTARIQGSRGRDFYEILPPHEIARRKGKLRSGDLLFFFKAPENRVVGEGVGHIAIVKVEGKDVDKKIFLIHASGTKSSGGVVKKVLLIDYVSGMPFVGVKVTRLE